MKGGYWWCTAANKTSHSCLLTSGAGRDVLAPLWPQPSITPWAVTHGKNLLKPVTSISPCLPKMYNLDLPFFAIYFIRYSFRSLTMLLLILKLSAKISWICMRGSQGKSLTPVQFL